MFGGMAAIFGIQNEILKSMRNTSSLSSNSNNEQFIKMMEQNTKQLIDNKPIANKIVDGVKKVGEKIGEKITETIKNIKNIFNKS
jgi:hypothetical protein